MPITKRWLFTAITLSAISVSFIGGCQGAPSDTDTIPAENITAPTPAIPSAPALVVPPDPDPTAYLTTNQQLNEGLRSPELDLRDVDAVFWAVFSKLPEEVIVYPSENYYYWIMYVDGRQIWGNIRLAAGHREQGDLSFAYFEFDEFDYMTDRGVTRAKVFTAADGVVVTRIDHFTYTVSHLGKTITFNLFRLPQEPPRHFDLGPNEVFVERTFDESGYQFFLIFNEARNYFFWVLNEEQGTPDTLDPIGEYQNALRGRRSGFVFWIDTYHDNRKVLVSIRQQSVERNDYFDGPFDQLADNYVDEVNISDFMVRASPALENKIDKYGYFTDEGSPMRVALSTYFTHYYEAQALQYLTSALQSGDPYEYIARRGAVSAPPTGSE